MRNSLRRWGRIIILSLFFALLFPKIVKAEEKPIGTFAIVRGEVSVLSKGTQTTAKVGSQIFEKDEISTSDKSVAKIVMENKNVLHVAQNSQLKISIAIVDLAFGKIRSQVVTKASSSDTPSFLVRTDDATVGVRGTDFIVTHQKEGDITKVETLKGTVELAGNEQSEKVLIRKGFYASYVTFAHKGFLTPVHPITSDQFARIDIETEYREDGSDRILADDSSNSTLCNAPKAALNQCSWTCQNNPKGATRCRTDLPSVTCVRTRCNASGRWAEQERLPASNTSRCQAETTVGSCDY